MNIIPILNGFTVNGLPHRILCDNGQPWGTREEYRYTKLSVWLIRLGITVSHSRACHPQTLEKDERFHRTLQVEVIGTKSFADWDDSQRCFDKWRMVYNFERPHEALGLASPAPVNFLTPCHLSNTTAVTSFVKSKEKEKSLFMAVYLKSAEPLQDILSLSVQS